MLLSGGWGSVREPTGGGGMAKLGGDGDQYKTHKHDKAV